MKRKLPAKTEPVVDPQILESAKRGVTTDRAKGSGRCSVCGSETLQTGPEALCWVCRRLKISAWRDVEQQAPVQE
jgi:hypothetical protein